MSTATQAMVAVLAGQLDDASLTATAIPQLSRQYRLSVDDGYAVQHALLERRLARGEHRIGVKLGFTSVAKAAQMGVADVIVGELTSGMLIPEGSRIDLADFVHPRVEPEVAFRVGRDIDPAEAPADAARAVDAVAAGLEVIDSRYRDFRFSLADVVADNTSAAGFALGRWMPLPDDLGDRPVQLEIDGRSAETGSTAAILGHPLRAVEAAIRMAAAHAKPLPAGSVILAGAATEAVTLSPGVAVRATVAGLGHASVTVAGRPS